MNFVWTQSDF